MIVLSSLHRIQILRYSVYCRLYTVRCKQVCLFLSHCMTVRARVLMKWEDEKRFFRRVIVKLESEEVGLRWNIPGRVVGGDYSCEQMVQVCVCHSWLTTRGSEQIQDLQTFSRLLKGSYPRKEGRLQLWLNRRKKMNRNAIFACLLILWSVVFCKDQITFIWLCE